MKKILLAVCIMVLCFCVLLLILASSLADRPGIADNVQVNIGLSDRFTQEEIESATDVVIASFGFINSELTYLWYDEDLSNLEIERSILDLDKESSIFLFSTIVVREPGGPGFLSVGTIEDLRWVLVRDVQSGEWELIASGVIAGIHF